LNAGTVVALRPLAGRAAIVEKAALVLGVLTSPFRQRPTVLAIALADAGMSVVYAMYLTGL
jgi:hypothetical protein